MSTALYAYCVVAAGAPLPACAAILPDTGIERVVHGDLAVLASPVPRALFESGSAEARTDDPAWMAERATAHHAVVVAASADGPALPLAFGALFSDHVALAAWLAPQAEALGAALAEVADAAEWSLSLSEDPVQHAAWLAVHDPALAALRRQVAAAGPGTAYLLAKRLAKLEQGARAAHLHATLQRLADLAAGHARHTATLPPRADRAAGIAALLPRASLPAMDQAVRLLAQACEGTGLAANFSGPWPPYAFARTIAAGPVQPAHV